MGEMRLTLLVDNNTFIDQYLIGEPAVSYYIETDGLKILFDAGYSDAFLINAQKLGIDLTDVDKIVLSHGHLDHTWGLEHLVQLFSEKRSAGMNVKTPALISHPDVFASRSYKKDPEIGSLLKEDSLKNIFHLEPSLKPVYLTSKLVFLGEVERLNDFEAKRSIGMLRLADGSEIPDMVMDDTALAFLSERGLVIITGCSHSGICNIVEYAKKITGECRILDVIGGFHLLAPSVQQMQGTLDYFQKNKPTQMHACHCTDLPSKIKLSSVADLREVGSGLVLRY